MEQLSFFDEKSIPIKKPTGNGVEFKCECGFDLGLGLARTWDNRNKGFSDNFYEKYYDSYYAKDNRYRFGICPKCKKKVDWNNIITRPNKHIFCMKVDGATSYENYKKMSKEALTLWEEFQTTKKIDYRDFIQTKKDIKTLEEYINNHIPVVDRTELNTIPLVINAYGGPCSGKSTTCLHLVAELKKLGFKAEYVSEYAKELVYDRKYSLLDGSVHNQSQILLEQNKRVERLVGNVDFIVSDSPILLSSIYLKKKNDIFSDLVNKLNTHYVSFSFFVERNKKEFMNEGRIHDLKQSIEKDNEIKQMLNDNQIFYGTYNHKTIDKIIGNCIKTFNRINKIHSDPILGDKQKQIDTGTEIKKTESNTLGGIKNDFKKIK